MNIRVKWVAAAIVAVGIAGVLGYALGHRGSNMFMAQQGDARSEAAPAESERTVLYWHDPMVPGTRFDKPGKSPFMDMQLVPVYADAGGGGDVRVDANIRQSLGIRLGKVEKKSLSPQLEAVGSVSFDERLVQVVQSRVDGNVTRLYVRAPLERVSRGQPLAEILAPQWLEAQQDYLALLNEQSGATRLIRDAARQRLVVIGVPEATIRALETDRKTNPTTTVVAPIDGVITELAVREGAAFTAGTPLLRINGLATVWVDAQIPENQAGLIAPGVTIEAHASAWPGSTFKGRMVALLPQLDLQTRTLSARIAIDNPQRTLTPGMFVAVTFTALSTTPQLVIPSEALIVTGERTVVIVAREDGAFDVAQVQVGAEQKELSAILSGVEEGQSIVLSGQFLIDSEASLRSTVDRLMGTP